MNKANASGVLPITDNDKYFITGEKTPIRFLGKIGVTLTWAASESRLNDCNKVCIFQRPASHGKKNEFVTGKIIETLNVGDLTIKHPYYHNCRLHHYAKDIYKPKLISDLLKLENTVNRIEPSITLKRKIIIFEEDNNSSIGPIQFTAGGPRIEELFQSLLNESINHEANQYIVEGRAAQGPFYIP